MDMTISKSLVHDFLRGLKGKIFVVEFTKRTDGSLRVMRCTTNYTSKLAGGELAYDANDKQLIPVYDLDKRGFRSIPTDAVIRIRALGNNYEVR